VDTERYGKATSHENGELVISSTIRFAVIGLGNIGRQHCESLLTGKVEGASLVAVCARSIPADLDFTGDVACFENYETLLLNEDIDAVLVATPTMNHLEIGMKVLDSGKHLLMEKPIGMNVLEADTLIHHALSQKQYFGAVLNQRYDAAYSKIRQMMQDGLIGELQRVSWTLTHWYRPEIYYRVSDWRGTWRGEGGGLLLNQCIHNLDVLQWLCGMPTSVWAQCQWGRYHDIEVEDEVTAVINFDNGATGSFILSLIHI